MAILSSDHVKMTSLLEKAISVIAPHRCIVCGKYDNVVCTACAYAMRQISEPFCVLCGRRSLNWVVCAPHDSALNGVYVASQYDGVIAEMIRRFKFDHARAAATPLAAHISAALPSFDSLWLVVPVPTVASHIRERGYDHAALLGRELAKIVGLPFKAVLRRAHNRRQIGANRAMRLKQLKGSIEVIKNCGVVGRNVLLVDDVCTTGSTLVEAAQMLKKAGVRQVWGAVAAWQPPKSVNKK